MGIKEITDYVTLLGAVVAAAAGVCNLLLQIRGKCDKYFVQLGSMSPFVEEETMLSVVSRSDHVIRLTDWGFIESNGAFTSLILAAEVLEIDGEEFASRGSPCLEGFGQHFETGYVRHQIPFGAYAISATQLRPVIAFDERMPRWRRVWIRLRLRFQPNYLAW